jgi:beta-N-acetylglucosaminidase
LEFFGGILMNLKNRQTRNILSLLLLVWAAICMVATCLFSGNTAEASSTGTLNKDYVYFRDAPAGNTIKYNGKAILLRKGQKMTIVSTSNKTWYKVKLTYKKKSYTGYVYSKYIKVTKTTVTGHIAKKQNYVYFRKTAGGKPITYNGKAIMLMGGQKMTILSRANKTWYKVKLTYKKKSYTGYVYSAFIVIDSTKKSTTTSTTTKATTQTTTQAATTTKSGHITQDYIYFRKTAGGTPITYNGSAIMLMSGQKLSILSTSNKSWYKVSLTYNSKSYTGYVSSTYIATESSTTTTTTSDAAFEKQLTNQGFPDSYKVLLRELHEKYPNWVFKAVDTGLDWNDVVNNEVNVKGRVNNLVNCTSLAPNYSWRSSTVGYNYQTDTYSSYDGATWFAASDQLVKYYLDPRNYLTSEKAVFAFEKLSYDSSQTKSGVETILSGSFMYNSKPSGSSSTYSELIITAAKKSGVSPYHIASRIKQEVGNTMTSGTNGKNTTYPGIYNFYNIGAFASASGNAITSGLAWASKGTTYNRPWTSASKSIIGGAMYIGESYINKGQNTLYTQKFNVTYADALYWHQYMGNIQAPYTEALKVYDAYNAAGALKKAIVFSIPVYKNMPSTRVAMPSATAGNPNNYLKELTVGNYKLSPSFGVNDTTTYTTNVDSTVTSISISATPVNSNATVSGTGVKSLKSGKNTFTISCKSQSGQTRKYTVIVNRG